MSPLGLGRPDGGGVAHRGPACTGGEAARKGLGAPEGPSIALLSPPAPDLRRPPSSRPAAPPRRDPRLSLEPDAVSATSSSASEWGLRRTGRAARPAARPRTTLSPGLGGPSPAGPSGRRLHNCVPRGGPGGDFPTPRPGLEPGAGVAAPPSARGRHRSGSPRVVQSCGGPAEARTAVQDRCSSPHCSRKTHWKPFQISFSLLPQTIIILNFNFQ